MLPSRAPVMDGIYALASAIPTRIRYVYVCTSCGLNYGEKPKPKRKKRG